VTEQGKARIGDFGKEVAPGPYKPKPVIPDEMRLEMARESIARWVAEREECDECEWASYDEKRLLGSKSLLEEGFEYSPNKSGLIRRCSHHGPKYSWAADLDPAKVVTWIDAECAKHGDTAFIINFDALREACT